MGSQQSTENLSLLYLSYTGLMEPLGKSQVYPYLRQLSKEYSISLVTFENPGDLKREEEFRQMQADVEGLGIDWRPLKYHNWPSLPATAWDIFSGIRTSSQLVRENNIEIVHARSYIPSVIALACKKRFDTEFVFDMRGFWADERVEGGIWDAEGFVYRSAKWFERQFITHADVIVSLTDAGIEAMKEFSYVDNDVRFKQIPTCTDLQRFQPPEEESASESFTLGYVGSVGTWYKFDDVIECFDILRGTKPNAQLHVLNKGQHNYVNDRIDEYGIPREAVTVEAVEHERVPEKIKEMDAGIFFYRQTFSKKGTSPTKMGEFLACGVPCMSNAGVGDVKSLLTENNVGVVLNDFTSEEKTEKVRDLIDLATAPDIDKRCRRFAEDYYSLSAGVGKYDSIYKSLI